MNDVLMFWKETQTTSGRNIDAAFFQPVSGRLPWLYQLLFHDLIVVVNDHVVRMGKDLKAMKPCHVVRDRQKQLFIGFISV